MAKFFSQKEIGFLKSYFSQSDFCVIGVGERCLEAYHYALSCDRRIDLLQLFLPTKPIYTEDLKRKGVDIEVYLAENDDEIAQTMKSRATIYTFKKSLFSLKESEDLESGINGLLKIN